jgi:hypothetical protein
MKSADILFYVNYTAVPVHSNKLCEHNENDETQEDVDADADSSSSSSTVSLSSSKQGQNKSTDETAQVVSIYMHTQNDFLKDLASANSRYCDWAMDSFSMTGFATPHQERCVGIGMKMITCTIEGCSTNVHPFCHIDWLCEHWYYPPPLGKHLCRQHSNSYQRWKSYKAGKIPSWQKGCIPGSAGASDPPLLI